jgi:hypothetical protein
MNTENKYKMDTKTYTSNKISVSLYFTGCNVSSLLCVEKCKIDKLPNWSSPQARLNIPGHILFTPTLPDLACFWEYKVLSDLVYLRMFKSPVVKQYISSCDKRNVWHM